jgi:hypothetical protein
MSPAEDQSPETEQSMDDILASIRRIMLDEQARLKESGPGEGVGSGPVAGQAPFARPEVLSESSAKPGAVLVLDDSMAVSPPLAAIPEKAAIDQAMPAARGLSGAVEETVGGGTAAARSVPVSTPSPVMTGLTAQAIEEMLAPAAAAAAAASVEALLRKLHEERQVLTQSASSSPSMEDVVRGELRPLLKSWLDEHLPNMVERLVRAELTRLTLHHGG